MTDTTQAPPSETSKTSVTVHMAQRYGMRPAAFEQTLRATVFPKDAPKETFAAFLLVARQYNLNPLLKEIYAYPNKGGGISPIVGVDGWAKIINAHPAFDGMEFDDKIEGTNVVAITCRMFRKDRSRAVSATEYLSECMRGTEPWQQWPRRMLRHKAMIQAARYAFGFSGIYDPDEGERMQPEKTVARIGLADRLAGDRLAVPDGVGGYSDEHVTIETATEGETQ